jgi:hypothetical protein
MTALLPPPPPPPPTAGATRLLELIHGGWTSQAVCAAVELGLADALREGGLTALQLAQRVQGDADAVWRLLRALASLGIVSEGDGGVFALTALGQGLRCDAPDSLHAQALWFGRHAWPLWGQLTDSVRTGLSGRRSGPQHGGYGHLQTDPAAAAVFNLAMVQLTRQVAAAVASACDFSGVRHFVDVGGGYGELLVACLHANPAATGTLLEMAHALPGARQHLARAGLAERAQVQEGDFFEALPAGADVYLLKAVMHNWGDAQCRLILARLRQAMSAGARLVVVERVLPDRVEALPAHQAVLRSDLNMLVGLGGRERTQSQFMALLDAAGFAPPVLKPAAAGFCAIQARCP